MLAQNFKTPAYLGIKDAEFDALLKVLGLLEREEVVHASAEEPKVPNGFNMAIIKTDHDCGTAACIYGWARTFHPKFQATRTGTLIELFCYMTRPLDVSMENISPAQAAIALRNYLTHGEPRWGEALAS